MDRTSRKADVRFQMKPQRSQLRVTILVAINVLDRLAVKWQSSNHLRYFPGTSA
jgi:hypothetical protein